MEKARIMNTKTTKRLLLTGALALSALAFSPLAAAQSWPAAKPIRIVIAFGPGSASDIIARLLGERLSRALGQSVIVDAKPGAAGQIAAEHVAGSPADGYTLFLTTNTTHSANPYLYKHLRYDPVKDFTPVSRIGYLPFLLLVNSQTPVKTLQELVAYAKANPAKANYAYTSSTGQIAAAALSNYTDMKAVGVAYKSAPEAVTSTLGGQVLFTILDFATTKGAVSAGRLRPLAVTPKERTSLAPESVRHIRGNAPEEFRSRRLDRPLRTCQPARADHQPPSLRTRQDHGSSGHQGAAAGARHGARGRRPRRVRRLREGAAQRMG